MGNGKIWPSADAKPLNLSSPNLKHVITSQIPSTEKILGSIRPGGFAPIYPKYTPKFFECLLHFIQFFWRSTDALVGPIFTLNTSFDVDLRKVVPFWGLENLNLKFDWVIKSQKSKFYNGAYGEI